MDCAFEMLGTQVHVHARHHTAMFNPHVAVVVDHNFCEVGRFEQFFERVQRLEKHRDGFGLQRLKLQQRVVVKVVHAKLCGRSEMRLLFSLASVEGLQKGHKITRLSRCSPIAIRHALVVVGAPDLVARSPERRRRITR
jgi:hypothetical protein